MARRLVFVRGEIITSMSETLENVRRGVVDKLRKPQILYRQTWYLRLRSMYHTQ